MDPKERHSPELTSYLVNHVVQSDLFDLYTVDMDALAIGIRT